MPTRSDGFLELLEGAERDLLGSLDLDRFAGRGVAAHAGGALANLQDAEAADADAVTLLQVLGDDLDHVDDDRLGRTLRQFVRFGEHSGDLLDGDRRSLGAGGRGSGLLRSSLYG